MKFQLPIHQGKFIKRYKRFFVDAENQQGEPVTIHCPNTGSMKNCCFPGNQIWYSESDNPKRKLPYTFEMIAMPDGAIIGVNTHRANHLVREAIETGIASELAGYAELRAEVKYGDNSRIDFLLTDPDKADCYVEVKNVTLREDKDQGYFPDAVSQRGTKHLHELMNMKQQGHRAVLFFCVQHTGIKQVSPAAHIDEKYTQAFHEARAAGVEVYAYGAHMSVAEITLQHPLPVLVA